MGKVNDNSRSEPLVDASLYFISCISTGKPADWVTDKYSLSPRRERVRVRGRNELYFILFCPCEDFFLVVVRSKATKQSHSLIPV